MEELVALGEGTLVKNSHPRDQQTHAPPTPTHIPSVTPFAPPPTFTQPFGGETCLTSPGGGEVLESVCFSLTQHIEF